MAFWRVFLSASESWQKFSGEKFGEIGQLAYFEASVLGF